MDLRPLTDDALLARLEILVAQERENIADIVDHLREVDSRAVVVDRGYSTLWDYCTLKLGYSEAAAALRIRAARAAATAPRVIEDLRAGKVTLDTVMRLYPHLTETNAASLLDRTAGATKKEVLTFVAQLAPGPAPERDVVRPLPPPESVRTQPEIIPPPERVRISFTADDELAVMLERLKRARRHKFPGGRLEDLIKEAVEAWLEKVDPPIRAKAPRPRKQPSGRWIPEWVKAAVRKRDGDRCAYVAPDGRRCECRDFMEFDQIVPWSLGGRSDDPANIRQLCRPHNQRLAYKKFGPRKRP